MRLSAAGLACAVVGCGSSVRGCRLRVWAARLSAAALACAVVGCGSGVRGCHLRLSDTPKAFANFSPGLLQPWERDKPQIHTLKALASASSGKPSPRRWALDACT